jgi:PAS domain S-box-containing protein
LDPSELLYVSPGFEKIYGYPPTTDRDDPAAALHRVVHPEDWERVRSGYVAKAKEGIAAAAEFRIIRPDGDVRWVRATTNPVADSDGVVRRTATTGQDITDRKQADAVRQQAVEAQQRAESLARANAAKNDFLARMSHELRTPLNAVLGFAQLLDLDDLTDDQHAAVRQISKGGKHLVELIDDVLDIAKIEKDQLDLSIEAFPLSAVITDTVQLIRPLADAARVRLEYQDENTTDRYVLVDQRRLRQVLLNLLSNAIKYNRPAGRVSISTALSEHGQVAIAVTDTGLGIRSDQLPRLFTPFDRLGAEATGIEGTGVGLALSRRLMLMMGGDLTAVSQEGSGSTFTVTVPAVSDSPPVRVCPSAAPAVLDPTSSGPGRR